uniref:toxic anion resistance protein n=1 Tax=Thaumasiovibrio occultus TaxID=1891184 RepID=UPI000B359A91|nr:toxic anion resistance protein [Thaumasiovibrio occultus]
MPEKESTGVEQLLNTVTPLTEGATTELTPEIVAIAEQFDPMDSVATITFGSEALEGLTKFTDEVLDQIKLRDSGPAGDILQAMVSNMEKASFDQVSNPGFWARLPLIGELFDSFKKFADGFDTVSGQLEQLAKQLEGQASKLAHDVRRLDGLYDENLNLLKVLEDFIAAGEHKVATMRDTLLPALLAKSESTGDALDAQHHRDAQQAMVRLEKRVHNLKLTRMATIQTAPQIRLSQEGNKMLMEDIQDIIHNTLPLWKRQFLIAISNYEKEKALKVTRAVKDYTNQQYVKNAEQLKALEEQIAENYQRGVLDLDSLETVNKLTIETLQNTLSRVKEGRAQREHAEGLIQKAEAELKQALQQTV